MTHSPAVDLRHRPKLVDRSLLLGIAVVAGLLCVSLFTGVYDIFGAEDGAAGVLVLPG